MQNCSVCKFEVNDETNEYVRTFIGHINKLCHAADIKNWTDTNHCYDMAEDTLPQVENTKRVLLGLKKKLRGLSPQANYTDRAAVAGRRS